MDYQSNYMPKVRKAELSFLYATCRLVLFYISVKNIRQYKTSHLVLFYISTKYHKNIPKGLTNRADTKSMDYHCQI